LVAVSHLIDRADEPCRVFDQRHVVFLSDAVVDEA
jgi:hypothetical protein